MTYLWLAILVLLNALWWGLTFFALPGNWLMIISAALFAWWKWDEGVFSIYTLIAITVLAVAGEVIEFFAGVGGAKKAGAGWLGALGALAGAVTGAIVGTFTIPVPFLGTLIGACAGAALGTWAMEHLGGRKMEDSVRSGVGAGIGVFVGTVSKVTIGLIIWLIIAIAAFRQ